MRIKKGDTVKVISGAHRGKVGKVLEIDRRKMRARVEGVAIVKRHVKPGRNPAMPEGGIIEKPGTIHVSNLMIVDPKTNVPTRIGMKFLEDGKKVRVSKRTGEVLD